MIILIALVLVSMPVVSDAATEQRIALVIGNSAYKNAPLRNPANDATDISRALKRLGFQVTVLRDASQRKMEDSKGTYVWSIGQTSNNLYYKYAFSFQGGRETSFYKSNSNHIRGFAVRSRK